MLTVSCVLFFHPVFPSLLLDQFVLDLHSYLVVFLFSSYMSCFNPSSLFSYMMAPLFSLSAVIPFVFHLFLPSFFLCCLSIFPSVLISCVVVFPFLYNSFLFFFFTALLLILVFHISSLLTSSLILSYSLNLSLVIFYKYVVQCFI